MSKCCKRCGLLETNSQVLKDCNWAKDVWCSLLGASHIPPYSSFREWLGVLLEQDHNQSEVFAVGAWQIWSAPNDLVFGKVITVPDLCIKRAHDILLLRLSLFIKLSLFSIQSSEEKPQNGFLLLRLSLKSMSMRR